MKLIRNSVALAIAAGLVLATPAYAQSSFVGSSMSSQAYVPAPSVPDTGNFSAEEKAVFDMVNQYRAENGIAPISWNDTYYSEAVAWGNTMRERNIFEHDKGIERFENLFSTPYSPTGAVESWKHSPGHNKNMLNADFKSGALAIVPRSNGGYYVILRGYFY